MRNINLIEYFSIQDLKGLDSYEMLKDISDKIGEQQTAELLELHGGTRFYIPNLINIKQVKERCILANRDLPLRKIAKELNMTYTSVYNCIKSK